MAHRKAGGTAKNLRDSQPQYLGVKLYAGEKATPGAIIIRQRGSRVLAGKNVRTGNDYTLFATKTGTVSFRTMRKKRFDGTFVHKKVADVQ